MFLFFLQGLVLGFAAGISPGPLLGLVISQTLHYGWRTGNLVALAPLLTDLPIILITVFLVSHFLLGALPVLAVLGGGWIIFLGIETVRTSSPQVRIETKNALSKAFSTAVVANFCSPHPYLFWATTGSTLLFQSFRAGSFIASTAFLFGFYGVLVGTKVFIAYLVSRSRSWLSGRTYHLLLRGSGVLLISFGLLLSWEGLSVLFQR